MGIFRLWIVIFLSSILLLLPLLVTSRSLESPQSEHHLRNKRQTNQNKNIWRRPVKLPSIQASTNNGQKGHPIPSQSAWNTPLTIPPILPATTVPKLSQIPQLQTPSTSQTISPQILDSHIVPLNQRNGMNVNNPASVLQTYTALGQQYGTVTKPCHTYIFGCRNSILNSIHPSSKGSTNVVVTGGQTNVYESNAPFLQGTVYTDKNGISKITEHTGPFAGAIKPNGGLHYQGTYSYKNPQTLPNNQQNNNPGRTVLYQRPKQATNTQNTTTKRTPAYNRRGRGRK